MEVRLPFAGFYESMWDKALDSEQEYYYDNLKEKYDVPKDFDLGHLIWTHTTYRRAYDHIAEHYVPMFESFINEALGLNIKLKFLRMTSPREYNFETDHIIADISYRDALILARRVGRNALRKSAKELFTSRSGFISFYRNDPAAWGRLRGWDSNHLYAVMCAAVDVQGDEDWEWSLVEETYGGSLFSDAFYLALDESEITLEIGKVLGRNELKEELEDEEFEAGDGKHFPGPGSFTDTKSYVRHYHALNSHKLAEGEL